MKLSRFCFLILLLCSQTLLRPLHSHEVPIHEHGYWIGDAEGEHYFDERLCGGIARYLEAIGARSIVDFGCGRGDYVRYLKGLNYDVSGYDGNPQTPTLSNGLCQVLDLSKEQDLGCRFDWVISLEIGEHIPPQYETTFIRNLIKHADRGIILSWAVVGQGGHGHVNCRNNDYIIKRLSEHGFVYDQAQSMRLRSESTLTWFKKTIMVFHRQHR